MPATDKKERTVLETMLDRTLTKTALLLDFGAMAVYVEVLLTEKLEILLCKRFSLVNRWLGDKFSWVSLHISFNMPLYSFDRTIPVSKGYIQKAVVIATQDKELHILYVGLLKRE